MKSLVILLLSCSCLLAQSPLTTGSGIGWTRATSSLIDPSSLPGLVMWMSITNGVTNNASVSPPANNDTVKGWADMSGNGNFLINLGGITVQPVYKTTGGASNNSPYIAFAAGTAQSLTNKFMGTKAQPLVFFAVAYFNAALNNALYNGAADQNNQVIPNGSTISTFNNGTSTTFANQFLDNQTRWTVLTCKFSGATSLIRTNGVLLGNASTTTGTLGEAGITFGNYFNNSGSPGLNAVEFLLYSGNSMSTTDMHNVETYLYTKYAMAGF